MHDRDRLAAGLRHEPEVTDALVLLEAHVGDDVGDVPAVRRQLRVGHAPELEHLLDGEPQLRGRLRPDRKGTGKNEGEHSKDGASQSRHGSSLESTGEYMTVGTDAVSRD